MPSVEARIQERLAAGDLAGAATDAIRGLGPKIVGYLRVMLRNEEDVAEVISRWAESIWRGIGSFEGRSSFRTWAFRLAFTSALKLRDQAHRRRERRLVTAEASALAEEVRTTALRFERRRRALDELRSALAADEQALLFLRVDQELSWDEVASVLSTPETSCDAETVRKRFQRLKEKLSRLARERGFVE